MRTAAAVVAITHSQRTLSHEMQKTALFRLATR